MLAFWVGPQIWRHRQAHDFYTAGDFLEFRYGADVRGVIASLIWLGTLSILAGQLIAGAAVLRSSPACPAAGRGGRSARVVMTVYFVAGGLLSSAWVNVVQLVVLLVGFLVAVPLVVASVGGLDGDHARAGGCPRHSRNFRVLRPGRLSGWTLPGRCSGRPSSSRPACCRRPTARATSAPSGRRRPAGAGAAALRVHSRCSSAWPRAPPSRTSPSRNLVLPTVLATQLPPLARRAGAGGGVLGRGQRLRRDPVHAVDVAVAGSLQAVRQPGRASDRQVLRVARLAAVVGGAARRRAGDPAARRSIAALTIFYSLLGVSLFVPILGGPLPAARRHAGSAGRRSPPALRRCWLCSWAIHAGTPVSAVLDPDAARPRRGVAAASAVTWRVAVSPAWRQSHDGHVSTRRKTAAVIGGGSGIGEAVALGVRAAGGARRLPRRRTSDAATPGRAAPSREGGGARRGAARHRRRRPPSIAAFADRRREHGRSTCVVCTPSINVRKPILDVHRARSSTASSTSTCKGNFNVLQAAGRIMTAQQRGSIVLFSSIRSHGGRAGPVGLRDDQGRHRAAGARRPRRSSAPHGVRVNAVGPGVVETPLTAPIKAQRGMVRRLRRTRARSSGGRSADEMVGPTLFLAVGRRQLRDRHDPLRRRRLAGGRRPLHAARHVDRRLSD